MNTDIKDYKKILKKYNFKLSDKEIIKIVKNIQDLANVFVQFAKNKNQQKNNPDRRKKKKPNKKRLSDRSLRY